MGLLELFRKNSISQEKDVSVQKKYIGDNLQLTFNAGKGNVVINVVTSITPTGSRGVMYDCFLIAANKWLQQGLEESEFISDMKNIISLASDGLTSKEIMKLLLKQHISANGRLLDSDLCTYISELYLAQTALTGYCNRDVLLDEMMQVAERNFGDCLFITMYQRVGIGLQPYLVTFEEFVNLKK